MMPETSRAIPGVYLVTDVRLYREGLSASLSQQSGLAILGSGLQMPFLRQSA